LIEIKCVLILSSLEDIKEKTGCNILEDLVSKLEIKVERDSSLLTAF